MRIPTLSSSFITRILPTKRFGFTSGLCPARLPLRQSVVPSEDRSLNALTEILFNQDNPRKLASDSQFRKILLKYLLTHGGNLVKAAAKDGLSFIRSPESPEKLLLGLVNASGVLNVKLLQLLKTLNPSLLPNNFLVQELLKAAVRSEQDNPQTYSVQAAQKLLDSRFKCRDLFISRFSRPLGVGSIGEVFEVADLSSSNQTFVAKFIKYGITMQSFEDEIALYKRMIEVIFSEYPEDRVYFLTLFRNFADSVRKELSLAEEYNRMQMAHSSVDESFRTVKPIKLSPANRRKGLHEILLMEPLPKGTVFINPLLRDYLEFKRDSQSENPWKDFLEQSPQYRSLGLTLSDPRQLPELYLRVLSKQALSIGKNRAVFHTNPHQGNAAVSPKGRIWMIDWGSSLKLKDQRKEISELITGIVLPLLSGNVDLVAQTILKQAEFIGQSPDSYKQKFQLLKAVLFELYSSKGALNLLELPNQISKILFEFRIVPNRSSNQYFQGVAEMLAQYQKLCHDLNVESNWFGVVCPYALKAGFQSFMFSPIQSTVNVFKCIVSGARDLPRTLNTLQSVLKLN